MIVIVAILVCVPLVLSILALSGCMLSARISRRAEGPILSVDQDEELPIGLSVSLSPR